MSLKTITPADARRLIADGAVIVDVREPDEHARERIEGANNAPLSTLSQLSAQTGPVIFHCKSGARTAMNATRLKSAAPCDAYILDGGIEAWKQAGLPTETIKGQPIEIMRQVQIMAGSLVLLGIILGTMVNPGFLWLAGGMGAGLVFTGVSGWCAGAKLLAHMPWNKRALG